MSFKKALEILKALPVEEQVLAAGTYKFYVEDKAVCGCAVGKIFPTIYEKMSRYEGVIDDSIDMFVNEYEGTEEWDKDFNDLDITTGELEDLQDANDGFKSFIDKENNLVDRYTKDSKLNKETINSEEVRKDRYHFILKWIEARIQEEATKTLEGSEG